MNGDSSARTQGEKIDPWPCHRKPRREWCDREGLGGFMGHTCVPVEMVRTPIPMLLWCPECGARHVDVGRWAIKSHHTHACQSCGMVWRPAVVPTVGVQYLPEFKNDV